ncbi:MAG: threonine--tRNA ligase [Bacteroidetes bacterium]|nr:threonine--tRNA ligase [Bacteroidota bacterium]MBK8488922.1 threonine--tRNA ligase [Bacteroidota bacterium]MBP9549201.1 threonine--tRNA ligase [Chitinophagales bacterium]MBP9705285.1 threonine--tRNA ligase [Chitinophagales bacterium]
MINITFPDGAVKQYEAGVTALDIAKSISEGLARKVLSADINGEIWDATRPLQNDATVKFLTWDDAKGKSSFWHSSAHLLAEALEALYPGVKFGIGPPIDNGFYYDVDLGDRQLTPEDLPLIEKKMQELAKQGNAYVRKAVSKKEALEYFTEKDDQYKLELISELEDGKITFYSQGNFVDLCRGPHIPNTSFIKAVKLTNIAGAYWRGSEKNKMLTRLYGITFPKQSELDAYITMLEEAKKRDHRKIGKELEIFTFDDDVGPGMPLWLPNGGVMIEQLERLAKRTEFKAGYSRVKSPHIAKESMYLKSGHLPYYAESMFPPMDIDGQKYYLKAMNCPHHHKIFDALPRSYRDLPLRLAEYGTCYRYEQSGELFGLMRVRSLQMNDAHIYCAEEQFEQEFKAVNDMYLKYFDIFGIDKYVMRFSTHDPAKLGQKYVDESALWLKTEDMVRQVLIRSGIPYIEVSDEAAFYGPKIDVQIWSAIGREFTLATNQVDFAQPLRFNLKFMNSNNEEETPIIIHRAPLGTHERFIGFLIEHYAGNFPVWLAPAQVAVLPISDKYNVYCQKILDVFKNHEIRTLFDQRGEKIGRKIRDAEVKKVPYMLIIGENEMNSETVSIRKHGEGDKGSMTIDEFVQMINKEVETIFS